MIKRKLENWKNDPSLDGLLFFCQVTDEMVSFFTIDSYRAPVFNTHSLCDEYLTVYYEVNEGFLHENALKPVIEELIWNLKNDGVAREVLNFRYETIITELENFEKKEQFLQPLTLIKGLKTLFDQSYFDEIKNQILEYIEKPNEKKHLSKLAKAYISELIYFGYSREYIRQELIYYFFQNQIVESINHIHAFLDVFSFEPTEWEVIFRGNSHFNSLKDLKLEIEMTISEQGFSPRTKYAPEKKFFEANEDLREYNTYIQFKKIRAFDPYGARQICEVYLRSFNDISGYSIHKEGLKWHSQAIAYSTEFTFFKVIDTYSPVLSIKDSDMSSFKENIEFILPIIRIQNPQFSYYFYNSLSLHSSAIQTTNPDNQLMNLWTALETLLPPPPNKQIRIVHFINSFKPFLGREYSQKLLLDLLNSLRSELGFELDKIFSKLPGQFSDFEKCASIISIKSNEPLRDEIYSILTKNRNLLLRFRVKNLMEKMHQSDSILSMIEEHNIRIKWQIQRIYRLRNLIVHKGNKLGYTNSLVENLHSYYHIVIDLIQDVVVNNEHIDSLDSIFYFVKIEHEAHLNLLKKSENVNCDVNNFRLLLFCKNSKLVSR